MVAGMSSDLLTGPPTTDAPHTGESPGPWADGNPPDATDASPAPSHENRTGRVRVGPHAGSQLGQGRGRGAPDRRVIRRVIATFERVRTATADERAVLASLYGVRDDPVEVATAVLAGVKPNVTHITDITGVRATARTDPLAAKVEAQQIADSYPDRFRAAWVALAGCSSHLPGSAPRSAPKAASAFVRAALALSEDELRDLQAPLTLVR